MNQYKIPNIKIQDFEKILINYLKYILLIGVVIIHSRLDLLCKNHDFKIANHIIIYISQILFSPCVPFYFFISSYLFYKGIEKLSLVRYIEKLKRRIYTLLIPYLLWNLLGLLCFLLKLTPALSGYFPQYSVVDLNLWNTIKGFWSLQLINQNLSPYPYDFVLWFIRDLMVFNILSPIFYYISKKTRILGTILMISLCILSCLFLDISNLPFNLKNILFYYLGVAVAVNYKNITYFSNIGNFLIIPCIMFSMMSYLYQNNYNIIIEIIYIITFIPSLCCVVGNLIIRKILISDTFIKSGFFIYAFHGLFITAAGQLLLHLINPESNIAMLFAYFLESSTVILFSTAIFIILKKIFPKLTKLLCGGRL